MSKRLWFVLSVTLTTSLLLTACAPATTPTPAPAASTTTPVQPTTAPAAIVTAAGPATVAAQPTDSSIKVGLVTDTDGVNDHAFNQLAWEGIQKASEEIDFQAKFIESRQPTDYEKNIDALATEGYHIIITVGSLMGDATALKAKQYPNIKFAIVDNAYTPTSGSQYCAETVTDCYSDGGLTNVTSLMFAEEQIGFLAGVLAGGMSRSGFVCSISSIEPPASDRYVINFRGGAVWQAGEDIRGMNNYINIQTTNNDVPNVADSTEGKETAQKLIDAGCDVVFGIAANGALLAARENNLMAIGFDVDQYNTYPEMQDALISSAQKNVDVAVYNYLKTVADSSVKAGISTATLQNGGVGLAPFHDWDSRIPADLKAQIQKASDGIKDGSIKIDLPQ
ncbi:MAG TPA: BMP family ABC transporter substrate-binding protein [Phototrophicaceae bacterium]|jgi:basic membrane protein A|nr:BMP family ABC transporter substrate-binding protein [Phototrophicaceae bacterium]